MPFLQTMRQYAAKVQEFGRLRAPDATRLLEEELRERNSTLSLKDKQQVISEANGDSWRLIQSMERRIIGDGDMKSDVLQDSRQLLFSFTDACGRRNRGEAWRLLQTLLRLGVAADRIFWTLVSHVRTLIRVGSLVENGTPHAELAHAAGIHPFVAKKASQQSQGFTEHERIALYQQLTELDFQTKQSRGDYALGLERLVLTL
jgi:DNA polymerase III delta subunit